MRVETPIKPSGLTGRGRVRRLLLWLGALGGLASAAVGAVPQRIFIAEFEIKGARRLSQPEIEAAVYPYLGPARSQDDVEQARVALERAYQAKGFQTVAVQIPQQPWRDGVIVLEVVEMPVGRLRVRGARFFLPSEIRAAAPSLAEGTVPNFPEVNRDIIALNQQADRRVTPSLRPGAAPGTVDIELQVQDTLPLHGSLELNNRASANTTELRLDGSLSYDNLWQRGHSIGGSFQVSPQDIEEVQVYTGCYQMPWPGVAGGSWKLYGTKQDSQVSTLGDAAVAGRGEIVGLQGVLPLPGAKKLSHLLILGVNYKRTEQDVTLTADSAPTQTCYYYFPLSVSYSAVWQEETQQTELTLTPTLSFRGWGSDAEAFGASRTGADGNFIYLRGDLAHTHQLPGGLELYGKIQGQVASKPLVSAEQFGGGGLGTVRGYREGEVFGDNGLCGRLELRGPALWAERLKPVDWRLHVFAEAGRLWVIEALPEQQDEFDLASVGVGSRAKVGRYFHASLDLGVPLLDQSPTRANDLRLTFRVWVEL